MTSAPALPKLTKAGAAVVADMEGGSALMRLLRDGTYLLRSPNGMSSRIATKTVAKLIEDGVLRDTDATTAHGNPLLAVTDVGRMAFAAAKGVAA